MKGSPPHMRGKGKSLCDDLQRVGITPAYAGKRRLRSRPGDGRKDHPRVCGEKRIFRFKLTPIVGSPPRMRGKGLSAFRRSHRKGITPAYAGKRHSAMHPETFCRDHPRVCGEKVSGSSSRKSFTGSPPRMRGKGTDTLAGRDLHRITPAYAGKSCQERKGWKAAQDHPRVCGEKADIMSFAVNELGSPPRMRGKD